jgi:preprotein translocase subunit YajC
VASPVQGAVVDSTIPVAHPGLLQTPRILDMPGSFASIPLLFAQNAPANGGSNSPLSFLPFLLVLVVWGYLLLFRPQQQAEKKRRQMIAALKKNDRVLTNSGIFGTVVSVDADGNKVVLRVDDDRGVKITFSKEAIAKVVDVAAEKGAAPEV